MKEVRKVTAKSIGELVYRLWAAGNPSNEGGLERKDFDLAVQDARAYKIKTDYWQSSKEEGERTINPIWLKDYRNVPILYDEGLATYYSELPAQPFGVPSIGGIQVISPMQNLGKPITRITAGQIFTFGYNPKSFPTYYYDGKRVTYQNINPTLPNNGVFMQMIPSIDDEIPAEFAYEIRELVLNQFAKNRGLLDKLADQNPNPREESAMPPQNRQRQ